MPTLSLVEEKIDTYCVEKSEPTVDLLKALAEETRATCAMSIMLTGPLEGRFLKFLASAIGARRILEIGMFTGYSALSMAEALPEDGELITCEIDQQVIDIAKRYYAKSEHGHKIHVKKGPALETLNSLTGLFDLAFIDADKVNYPAYYEATLPLLRKGGLIIIDNALYSGEVLKPESESSTAIANLNSKIARDERVDRVLLPVRDGIFCIRKR